MPMYKNAFLRSDLKEVIDSFSLIIIISWHSWVFAATTKAPNEPIGAQSDVLVDAVLTAKSKVKEAKWDSPNTDLVEQRSSLSDESSSSYQKPQSAVIQQVSSLFSLHSPDTRS